MSGTICQRTFRRSATVSTSGASARGRVSRDIGGPCLVLFTTPLCAMLSRPISTYVGIGWISSRESMLSSCSRIPIVRQKSPSNRFILGLIVSGAEPVLQMQKWLFYQKVGRQGSKKHFSQRQKPV